MDRWPGRETAGKPESVTAATWRGGQRRMTANSKLRAETLVTRLGRDPARQHHAVNPPVYHASTLAFDSVAEFEAAAAAKFDKGALFYGRYGMPTTHALESAVAELEASASCPQPHTVSKPT